VRLVTCEALLMPRRAVGDLVLVAACAGCHSRQLVHRPLVASSAARVAQIAAGETNLEHVASTTQVPIAELAQVEAVRLVTAGTSDLARMKRRV